MRPPPIPAPVSRSKASPEFLQRRFGVVSPTRWAGVVLLLLSGCSQAHRAASLLNEYDYRENRYEEACLPYSTKPFCSTAKARLDSFRRHSQEMATAVKNGGSAHLQIDLVKRDAKGLRDVE